jgi:hypothetical protein
MFRLFFLFPLLVAVSVAATITPIQPSPSEPDLAETLDAVYGAGGYFRIDDDLDQIWQAGQYGVLGISTYSGVSQTLGYCSLCDGSDDVLFDSSLDTDGVFSIPLTVSGIGVVTIGSSFSLFDDARALPYTGKVYSNPSFNADSGDHMVTFGVTGRPNTYIVAFEDWMFNTSPTSDHDYQDAVFEVTYLAAPPSAVPEPSALLTLAGGLAAFVWFRRRNR